MKYVNKPTDKLPSITAYIVYPQHLYEDLVVFFIS